MKERPGSPRVRLFVALDLPEPVVAALTQWTRAAFADVPDLRIVRPESLHVTLVFLGYQSEKDVGRITGLTFAAPLEPVELEVRDVQPVPRGRPRLFVLALEDRSGALTAWQQGLADRLQGARLYEPEKRPFWPHVTLARAKRGKTPRGVDIPSLPAELQRPFATDRITLYRSTLRPQGAVYEALAATAPNTLFARQGIFIP